MPRLIMGVCWRAWRVALLALWLGTAQYAVAAGPAINSFDPPGGQRGTEVELRIGGARLGDVTDVLFYSPGIELREISASGRNQDVAIARLAISDDCPLGVHALRVVTRSGISNLRLFSVGALPETGESEPNNTLETAQSIALGTTINGTLQSEDTDYFMVEATVGERLTAEVEAIRLGRGMHDTALAILDEQGNRLVADDDTPLVWCDAVVSLIVPKNGKYFIELREASGLGNGLPYRLHVGRFPRPLAVLPAGGKPGETLALQLMGDVGGVIEQSFTLPDGPEASRLRQSGYGITAQDTHGVTPSPNFLRINALDNLLEQEPNDEPGTATPFVPPLALNGVIGQPGDSDHFVFSAKRNDRWEVQVHARSLRSRLDPVLRIVRRSNGALVGVNDDNAGSPDSYLRFTAPADDEYVIVVHDLMNAGGPDYFYRVEVTPVKPSLVLSLPERDRYVDMTAVVPQGNRMAMMVNASRRDFNGQLVLDAQDLPPGVSFKTVPMAADQNAVPVIFTASAEAALGGALVDLQARLQGPAEAAANPPGQGGRRGGGGGGGAARRRAAERAAEEAKRAEAESDQDKDDKPKEADPEITGRLRQTSQLTVINNAQNSYGYESDRLAMVVAEPVPFELELVEPQAPLVRRGSLGIVVRAKRAEGFTGRISVVMLYTPNDVGAPTAATIEADKDEVVLPLTAGGGAPLNEWPICVMGYARQQRGERDNRGRGPNDPSLLWASSDFAKLQIAESLMTAEFKPVAVEQGKTLELKIPVSVRAGFPEKAEVELVGLPAEVVVEPLKISPQTKELVFQVRTSDKSPPGKHRSVMCRLTTTINGEKVTQLLGPTELRIDTPRRREAK